MASTMRQRVLSSSSPSISTLLSKSSRKIINPLRQSRTDVVDGSLGWFMPVFALGVLRYMSAMSNILHDCDEVFNYWEPLHFLLYKSGFQTWEYSSQYALRSYLYISVHEFVGRPAAWLFGEEKVRVFYAVRLLLGTISVVVDATLVVALSRKYGKRLASYALAMLCLTSGCFFSSTSFLPSSFSMYAMSLSSGLFLLQIYSSSIAVAAVGVLLGWPFSILAFMPIAFCSLIRRFRPAFFTGLAISIFTFVLSVLVDCHFYGRWTSSIANLLLYNVFEGESHLYGTEGKLFYLWNGLNNFNLCFILALLFLLFWPIVKRKHHLDLLIVVSPLYLWLMFMCLQPHKEERFIYPIYPLICVAASAVIEIFPDIFEERYHLKDYSITIMISKFLRPVVLGLILCASHSRTFSIINGYGAPLEIYNILDHHDDVGNGSVLCVGSEWHRFPSSFFVPNYIAEIRWIDDGFQGLLPFPFNSTLGGTGTATATAPLYFNNKNKASFEQFLYDLNKCTFLVELQLNRSHHFHGNDLSKWENPKNFFFTMAKSSFPIIFFATILCFSPLFYYASASYLSVEGQVYCDTCRVEFQTKLNEPLPGAKVLLECRSRETDQVTYSVQGEADSSGTYRLPVDGDYEEDICEVKLTKSPREDCSDLFKTSINTARVLLTKNVGVVDPTRFANALGYMTKEAKAECGQVLEDMGFLPLDD